MLLLLFVVGCATQQQQASRAGVPKSVTIELKGKPGNVTETRYFSNARILTYEDGQLVRDRTEGVDFLVTTRVRSLDPKAKLLSLSMKTLQKDGASDLHDLAFPELNEEIDYIFRLNAEVVKAGGYPKESIFFVPSLPMPKSAVEIGDTWTMDHTWLSSRDAIPLRLEVVAILKDIVRCEKSDVCVDIEINGHVGLGLKPTVEGSIFESKVWGRVLFSLDRGDVLWSEMRSDEKMGVKANRVSVRSCMVSEVKGSGPYRSNFNCDPSANEVGKTPVF